MSEFIEDRYFAQLQGFVPQLEDERDVMLSDSFLIDSVELPKNHDPRDRYPKCYDQEDEGSCTGNTAAGASHWWNIKTGYKWKHTPSRQFIYYNGREVENFPLDQDTGCTIRGVVKALAKYGYVPEDTEAPWNYPYITDGQQFKTRPPQICYDNAVVHTALKYQAVPQDEQAVKSLLSQDIPILFGFQIYKSFMTKKVAESGVMPKRSLLDGRSIGGHAVLAVGYLSDYPAGDQGIKDWIIVRNSWGPSWGQNGYFLMPLSVFLGNQCMDFWAITELGHPKKV